MISKENKLASTKTSTRSAYIDTIKLNNYLTSEIPTINTHNSK